MSRPLDPMDLPKVVIDLTSVIPGRGGGVERVAVGVIDGLAQLGVETRGLIAQNSASAWSEAFPSRGGIALEEVRISLRAGSRWQSALRVVLPSTVKRSRLVGWVRGRRSQAVRAASMASTVWYPFHRAVASAESSVVTVHDLRVFQTDMASQMDQQIISANIRSAKAIVCSWAHPYNEILELFPEAGDKLFRIPLPVLNAGPPTVRRFSPGSRLKLLYPAFVTPHKNQELIVRALKLLPDVEVTFTGADNETYGVEMKALAKELGVDERIQWAGYVSVPELERAYQQADLLVMPSRWEAASGPIFEAVSRGLPFLAADIPPVRSQVLDLGIDEALFGVDDHEELARLIRAVAENYDSRVKALADPGEKIRTRTWQETAADYARVFAWAADGLDKPTDLQGTRP